MLILLRVKPLPGHQAPLNNQENTTETIVIAGFFCFNFANYYRGL
jgi:hypothetical protein